MSSSTSIPAMTDHDRELLRTELFPQLDALLWDAGELEDAEDVERMTCELLLPFQGPEMPPQLASELVGAIERSDAPAATDLLTGLAALGAGEVARCAADACGRRSGRSRFEGRIGRMELRAAACLRDGAAEVLQLRFERPGTGESQLAAFFIEREETGGAALGGTLTAPVADAQPFIASSGGAKPRSIGLDKARSRAQAALARTSELDLAVERELGVCLPMIALGLTGSADGLPQVDVELLEGEEDGEPGPLYVDPLDEESFALIERGLLSELGERIEASADGGLEAEYAQLFAGSLLHWKWGYADGRLGTWTCDDVAEFLLDYMPRKMPTDEETLSAVPVCVIGFLRFLDERGTLAGDPLDELVATVDELSEELAEAANDPGNWGLAKSIVAAMDSDGVDVTDQAATEAWMADFNSRPQAERDRVVGPALERMGPLPAPDPTPQNREVRSGPSKQERRGKRKQARTARKRNRR
jgi:hypothetical protein